MTDEQPHQTSHVPFPLISRKQDRQDQTKPFKRKSTVKLEVKMITETASESTIKCRQHTHRDDVIICSFNDLKKRACRSKVHPKMPLHSPNKHYKSIQKITLHQLDISTRRAQWIHDGAFKEQCKTIRKVWGTQVLFYFSLIGIYHDNK